jgi:tetratricopeptide (TPR) repeat protein
VLKVVAGVLGIGLDDLVQRENLRRQRRLATIAAGALVGMLIAIALAVVAVQARDAARDQRREAEGLIGFMLGDLKDKLEPIGKLDALDGVGARVLAYYQKQGTSDLPDSALLQRSRALSLMGEVADARGDLDTASALYKEAAEGTAEAVRRSPNDPQRLFEHAQNEFYLAEIASRRGRLDVAEAAFREYKRLADRMVAVEPNNMKWRMEAEDAEGNLAAVVYQQRRYAESAALWAETLRTIEALAIADPNNSEYQKSLLEALAWYADAEFAAAHFANAAALRERQVKMLTQLEAKTGDVSYIQKLIPAERSLGNIYASQGRTELALRHVRAAVAHGDRLIPIEPSNKRWLEYSAKAKLNLADLLLATRNDQEARQVSEAGCAAVDQLLRTDRTVPEWRAARRDCLLLRAQLELASGSKAAALGIATQAVDIAKSLKSADSIADRYSLAKAIRVLGDAREAGGDGTAARSAWQTAIRIMPTGVEERPIETSDRIQLLLRLGRVGEAEQSISKLSAVGYRYPSFSTRPRRSS